MKKLFSLLTISMMLASISTTANAAAEKGWRYWGYFQAAPGATSWSYAQTGPAGSTPKDGAVEGWRYSFSSDTVDTGNPTLKPNFKATCSGVKPVAGMVRVAVVVDFGLRAIAPKGESVPQTIRQCVSVKAGTNGLDILNKVVPVRASAEGFVCGLNSFPAKECSTEILTPKSLLKK
jgi:hypothetical protein